MPEWLLKVWNWCSTVKYTGALVIRFLDGKPVKVETERHFRPESVPDDIK